MLKLMQLKYPTFPAKMTSVQAQQLVHGHAYVARDYQQTLRDIENRDSFTNIDRLIQFPFTAPVRNANCWCANQPWAVIDMFGSRSLGV
jgi:actin-related protein 5